MVLGNNFIKRTISSILIVLSICIVFYFGGISFYCSLLILTWAQCRELLSFMNIKKFYLIAPFLILLPNSSCIYIYSVDPFVLYWMICCIFSTDVFAYITGNLFGKRKMFPSISPNKTWEGAFGGFLSSIISGFFFGAFSSLGMKYFLLSGFISITSQFGDMIQSYIKRSFGVSNSGSSIPGHGGLMDRTDSFIISAPIMLFFV